MNLTNQIPQNQPIHVAFDHAAVPGQGQAGGDRVLIAAQAHHE